MVKENTVAKAAMSDGYGSETVEVVQFMNGSEAGKFRVRGAGYSPRARWNSVDAVRRTVQADRRFKNWEN